MGPHPKGSQSPFFPLPIFSTPHFFQPSFMQREVGSPPFFFGHSFFFGLFIHASSLSFFSKKKKVTQILYTLYLYTTLKSTVYGGFLSLLHLSSLIDLSLSTSKRLKKPLFKKERSDSIALYICFQHHFPSFNYWKIILILLSPFWEKRRKCFLIPYPLGGGPQKRSGMGPQPYPLGWGSKRCSEAGWVGAVLEQRRRRSSPNFSLLYTYPFNTTPWYLISLSPTRA